MLPLVTELSISDAWNGCRALTVRMQLLQVTRWWALNDQFSSPYLKDEGLVSDNVETVRLLYPGDPRLVTWVSAIGNAGATRLAITQIWSVYLAIGGAVPHSHFDGTS